MIAVVQVVTHANVSIYGQKASQKDIGQGLLVFLGIAKTDTEAETIKLADKLVKLRLFPDGDQKMNLDVGTVHGSVLLISQFTLLGDLRGGNRPDFTAAADKEQANSLYQLFADKLVKAGLPVKTGYFAEHMGVTSLLNGPVTIILDSEKI